MSLSVKMEAISVSIPKHVIIGELTIPSCNNLFSLRKLSRFPVNSVIFGKPGKKVHLKVVAYDDQENNREYKKLPPSEWGHHFLYVPIDVSEMDTLGRKIEALKPKVKGMLMPSIGSDVMKKRILLIHLLISLGLAYHFQDEIEENVKDAFQVVDEMMAGEDDLYTVSTLFWVFRKYGHNMSSDFFKRFKGDDGKFKKYHIKDVKGMLSLYEASHLGTKTDVIMEEAMSFTLTILKSLADAPNLPHLSMLIRNALCIPQHRKPEMLFAREYITFYEQEEDHNKFLLEFAKLNFKFLQLNWIQELKILTKWWKEQDLESRLPPFFRDRLLENYFFAFTINFEPRFSRERIIMAKLFNVLTIVDDACDRYGSVSEVAALVHSIERWDPNCTDGVPDYMKTLFKFSWDVFEESEKALSYSIQDAVDEFKLYLKANQRCAEWEQGDIVPTFEEYLEIGGVGISMYIIVACSFLGLGHIARETSYEWLKSRPKFITAQATKVRIMNDITGFEDDTSRGHKVNAINYYMKQYGVSKEETLREFNRMIRDINKLVNEEDLKTRKTIPHDILSRASNVGKIIDVTYITGEEFTNPQGKFKDYITSLFVNLIPL